MLDSKHQLEVNFSLKFLYLRPLLVRLIDSRGNVSLVARWLIQWVEWLVPPSHLAMVVRSVLVEVEVLCAIFLDQLLWMNGTVRKCTWFY